MLILEPLPVLWARCVLCGIHSVKFHLKNQIYGFFFLKKNHIYTNKKFGNTDDVSSWQPSTLAEQRLPPPRQVMESSLCHSPHHSLLFIISPCYVFILPRSLKAFEFVIFGLESLVLWFQIISSLYIVPFKNLIS